MDDPFARGARLFDAGELFEAHEVWEGRCLLGGSRYGFLLACALKGRLIHHAFFDTTTLTAVII